jgi:hypothetical protein
VTTSLEDSKGSRKTKIAELELTLGIDKKVLRFQISVKYSVCVAEINSLEKLVHKRFDGGGIQRPSVSVGVHVLLQILVHIFKYQHELILSVDDIVKANNILVLEFLHERNLADSCGWGAFFRIEVDLFQCHQLTSLSISTFEDLGMSVAFKLGARKIKDDSGPR